MGGAEEIKNKGRQGVTSTLSNLETVALHKHSSRCIICNSSQPFRWRQQNGFIIQSRTTCSLSAEHGIQTTQTTT